MELQVPGSNLLGNVVKGFKGWKPNHTMDTAFSSESKFDHLEGIFMKNPFPESSPIMQDIQEEPELNIGHMYFLIFLSETRNVISFFICLTLFARFHLMQMILKLMSQHLWRQHHLMKYKILKEVRMLATAVNYWS